MDNTELKQRLENLVEAELQDIVDDRAASLTWRITAQEVLEERQAKGESLDTEGSLNGFRFNGFYVVDLGDGRTHIDGNGVDIYLPQRQVHVQPNSSTGSLDIVVRPAS